MARERMVTRTITTNIFTVIAVNMETLTVERVEVSASVEVDTIEKAEKYFRKNWNIDGFSFAKVESVNKIEKLFGMSEADFMRYAHELPPRTTNE